MPRASLPAAGIALPAGSHLNSAYFGQLARLRREAQAEIDRLLDFLDRLDGDPDLEDGGDDEPSLGWLERQRGFTAHAEVTTLPDLEESEGDLEPSLGRPDEIMDQRFTAIGPYDDREAEHDGREPSGDEEPSLGWAEGRETQVGHCFGTDDLEDGLSASESLS